MLFLKDFIKIYLFMIGALLATMLIGYLSVFGLPNY